MDFAKTDHRIAKNIMIVTALLAFTLPATTLQARELFYLLDGTATHINCLIIVLTCMGRRRDRDP